MIYDKYEEQQDFSLNKNNKKQNSISEKKSKTKTSNNIYTSKHIRKTVNNLNNLNKTNK